jgi:hypothetical protein
MSRAQERNWLGRAAWFSWSDLASLNWIIKILIMPIILSAFIDDLVASTLDKMRETHLAIN